MDGPVISSLSPLPSRPAASASVAPDAGAKKSQTSERPAEALRADETNPGELSAAVQQINDFVQVIKRNLQFSVDDSSGRIIITVTDSETDEVIREIPPEDLLSVARNLEEVKGLLFKARA